MSRFYLHIHNAIGFVRDEEGEDFPSPSEARERALDSIRSVVCDEARQGVLDLRGKVEIADEAGELVMVVPFLHAFDLKLEGESC